MIDNFRYKKNLFFIPILLLLFLLCINHVFGEINTSELNYEPEILEEFNKTTEVSVVIKVRDTSNITLSSLDMKEQQIVEDNKRKEFLENKTNLVLATLSETEFKLEGKFPNGRGFYGNITKEGFDKLIKNSDVKMIYLERISYIALDESRPLINADDVETLGYNGTGETVCVLDTGIDYDHTDLGGCFGSDCKVRGGYDYYNNDTDPDDDNGHGTNVAGIVASEDITYRGIAPDADFVALKVCSSTGSCPNSKIVSGLAWCYTNRNNHNISVVSISIGDWGEYPPNCPTWADDEINDLYAVNIPVIVASGNNGHQNGISYPACSPNAISVGAVYDENLGREPNSGTYRSNYGLSFADCYDSNAQIDNITCFTNRGNNLDLLAPGAQITSTGIGGGTSTMVGTSQAAPHVSGAAALLLEAKPSLTPNQIEIALKNTGKTIQTWKRINVSAALEYICDEDGDGYLSEACSGGNDCDDNDGSVHPEATEACDGKDNDCDDIIDEGCEELQECEEPGYEQCIEYLLGDCDVRIALNEYGNVNNIKWGAVNDAYDPYVIDEYKIGWKAVDAEQMYYGSYVNYTCEYGGCDPTKEIVSQGTKVTVTAPGTASHEMVLGYDDTPSYWCMVWFNDFNPNYGGNNPIYVLNCYDDNDCSSGYYCDKSGSWSTWDCVAKKSNGQSCTSDNQCQSNYCDNDGVGLADDNWCFTPYNTYFDGQETSYCEYSTDNGISDCDERQVGGDLNKCVGTSYYEEECSSTCSYQDITSVFECNEAGCSCTEPLCDGLTTGSDITTCASGQTYFADKCTSTASGEDRGDNICRSSAFASGCTADSECNGVTAGSGDCTYTCEYLPDTTPPQWRNQGQNTSTLNVGEAVLLYAEAWDETGLDWAWLETNETGVWQNYTFTGLEKIHIDANDTYARSFKGKDSNVPPVSLEVGTEYSSTDYIKIGADDGDEAYIGGDGVSQYPFHRYNFSIPGNITVNQLEFIFIHTEKRTGGGAIKMYLWNFTGSSYNLVSTSATADGDFDYNLTNFNDFISGNKLVVMPFCDASVNCDLFIDYVYINMTYKSTYESLIDMGDAQATWTWSNFTWKNESIPPGTSIGWRIYYNDTAGNENVTDTMTFTIEDITPPTYSNNSTNSTNAGQPTEFGLKWNDNTGLSGYIFSWINGTNVTTTYTMDGTNNKAYNGSDTDKPPTSLIPVGEQEFSSGAYTNISSSDDNYFTSASAEHPYHKFNITVNESVDDIENINITWEGHSDSDGTINLYVYNFSSDSWDSSLGNGSGTSDFTLSKTFTSGFSDIINSDKMSILIQDPVPEDNSRIIELKPQDNIDYDYTSRTPLVFQSGQFILNKSIVITPFLSINNQETNIVSSGLAYTHSIIDYGYYRKWGLTIDRQLSAIDYAGFEINCKHYAGYVFHCGDIEVDFSDLQEQGYDVKIIGNKIYVYGNFIFNDIILDPTDQLKPNSTHKAYMISSTSSSSPDSATTEFTSTQYNYIFDSNNVYATSTAEDLITYTGCQLSDALYECKHGGEECVSTGCKFYSGCADDICDIGSCVALTQATELSKSCSMTPHSGASCGCLWGGCYGKYPGCSAWNGTCTISGTCNYVCNSGKYNCDGNDANGCEASSYCGIYTFQRFTFNLTSINLTSTIDNMTFCYEGKYASTGGSYSSNLLWYNVTSSAWVSWQTLPYNSENIYCLYFGSNNISAVINSTSSITQFAARGNQSKTGHTLTLYSDFSYLNVTYTVPVLAELVSTDFIEVRVKGKEFVNDTWTNSGWEANPTTAWSNVTKIVNENVGRTIYWIVYANDTSDNWNTSEIYSFVTT